MKKPKVPAIKLPYASTVASFFGDQGATQGNSFLGRFFKGRGQGMINQTQGNARATPLLGNLFGNAVNQAKSTLPAMGGNTTPGALLSKVAK